jgi:hypothetical protein
MNIAIKSIVSCKLLGLEESFKALVLGIHFPGLANMLQTKEMFTKIYNMCESNLFIEYCKNP